jgi:hypothetical protein
VGSDLGVDHGQKEEVHLLGVQAEQRLALSDKSLE